MCKNNTMSRTMPIGVLWFVHDNPGITEKVPYMSEDSMLDAIRKFYNKYGPDHESEFMIIFADPENNSLNTKIEAIVGADYGVMNMNAQPRLF